MKTCPKCGESHGKAGKFCSRSCANSRNFTQESNLKRSISNQKACADTPWTDERKQQLSLAMKASHKSRGHKTSIPCTGCSKLIGPDNKFGMCRDCFIKSDFSSVIRGHHYKNYKRQHVLDSLGQQMLLMSSLEIEYFKYLCKNNIKWKKPECIKYTSTDGKSHWYKPDFHLIDSNEIIEVKGHWWNNDRNKMDLVIQQNASLNIKILMKKDIDDLISFRPNQNR